MDDDGEEFPNETIPPFDVCEDFIGPTDVHEAHRRARTPDSSLDEIKPYVTPRQLEDLHLYFFEVWDKHHGF